jgi:hypothetical protein
MLGKQPAKNRLLGISHCADQRRSKLVGEVPGRLEGILLGRSGFWLANVKVTTLATEKASFHSRPFGLANSPTWCRSLGKASKKVYLSVNFSPSTVSCAGTEGHKEFLNRRPQRGEAATTMKPRVGAGHAHIKPVSRKRNARLDFPPR